MPRYQDAVPSTPSQYEQRPTPRRVHDHEGKRRRVLRWLKKTMGLAKVEKEEAHASPVNQCPQPYDEPPRAIRRASLTHGTVKDAPSLSLGSHSSTYDQDLEHPSFYAPSTSGRPLSLSSLATSSLNVPAPSSPQPSIYEYHHQMPRHRKPRLDSSRVVTNGRPHVLIIGGGIGGLCLAQGLKKNGIPFTIFERDPTPNYRTQGYRLRINNAGLEALKYNLMGEDFEVFLRSTGHFRAGFMYVNALTGGAAPESVKDAHRAGSTHHVLSTDRSMLRSLLLTDLHEGTEILFGMAFKKYDILANGRIEVQFENGQCFDGSVLVGADGTTSRVRRQYIPRHITLLDTDSAAIYGKTPITPEIEQYFATATTTVVASQHPHMAVVIDPRCGSKFHIEDYIESTGGIENPANEELADLHNYLCWVLIARSELFRMDDDDDMTIQDLYAMSPEEVAELSIQMTSSWCPRVRALFETQDAEWCSFLRLSTMAPEINSWQPSQVTLLGDACHTMIPAGIGCNTAMLDARLLVENFCEYGVTIEAIARYENAMRQHGQEGIEVSMQAGRTLFGLPEQDDMRKIVY